jgi:hypothetical protein
MSNLLPCPACQRHVGSEETTCPFCQATLSLERPCAGGCSGPLPARLARAALVAAAAGALGAACQSQRMVFPPYGLSPLPDAGAQSTHDAGEPTDGSPDSKDAGK